MTTLIHPTAIVSSEARLGVEVAIGPYSVIGPGVEIGDRCKIGPHCVVAGPTRLGPENILVSHAALGNPPQDLKYSGEPTELEVGRGNTIREFVTFNRGTVQGGGKTTVGDDNLFMTQAHVAHDCTVGGGNIFANAATLAGHVGIGHFTTIGAFSAVHQFCRVGDYAFIGGFTVVTRDALPFMKTVGQRGDAKSFGPNRIGLERRGFERTAVDALAKANRILGDEGNLMAERLAQVEKELGDVEAVQTLIAFIKSAKRGIIVS